ncbi:unnamed protein product [Orchesella dallaii]|uniref:Uncharacterized protein n=1 Tax=Orchesella dallaii TaxID=48710 RepID=A0ABP1PNW6_9HEXA
MSTINSMLFIAIVILASLVISETRTTVDSHLSDCLIHVINGEEIQNMIEDGNNNTPLTHILGSATTLSYTIHKISHFDFLPQSNYTDYTDEDFDIDNVEVNFQSGFLRYIFRLSSSCLILLIKTTTFNETRIAIQRSAHGTSEHVLFLIETFPMTVENEVINGFENELLELDGTPFHAPIAFYCEKANEIAILCYFCPSELGRIQRVSIANETLWRGLLAHYKNLNSNGYGNEVDIPNNLGYMTKNEVHCFEDYDSRRVRTNLFGEHVNCKEAEAWSLASVQSALNISISIGFSDQVEEISYQKWMLQIRVAEGYTQVIPNIYIYSRGSFQLGKSLELDFMACMDLRKIQEFNFNIISALDFTSWCSFILLILLYGLAVQNIWKGLDFLCTFLGKPLMKQHVKSYVCITLLAISIFSYAYQSTLSAESMQLAEFPTFKKLVREGYRVWVLAKGPVGMAAGSLSNYSKNGLQRYLGVDATNLQYYVSGKGDQNMVTHYNNTLGLFMAAAKHKLFVTSISYLHMLKALGQKRFFVKKFLLCKVDRITGNVELSFAHTFRSWGYLSNRFSQVLEKHFVRGDRERLTRLKEILHKMEIRELMVTQADALIEPKSINLRSAVGVCCWVYFAVSGLLFIWWGIALFILEFLVIAETQTTVHSHLSDCLIHVINGEEKQNLIQDGNNNAPSPQFFDPATNLSYTIHQISHLDFLPQSSYTDYLDKDFDIDDVKVNVKSGFLRYIFRLSISCLIFLIKAQTFNETRIAIQRSAHGTSEHVLFLIETFQMTVKNEVINGFENELFELDGTAFHAPIAFYSEKAKEMAMLCYFCPSEVGRIQRVSIGNETLLRGLLAHYKNLNSNGYGN